MKSDSTKDIAKIFREGTLIDAALARAALESKQEHERLGLPAAVWRDGKVVWIPAEASKSAEMRGRLAARRSPG